MYLVSDFRTRQFASATDVRKLLDDLKEKEHVAQIHLVRCVREARPNLAITSLVPESGVRAAGVEMWMNVTVANYGDAPARGVIVQLEQDGDALPALALDDIPPREEITHKFRVQFAGIGAHWLSASLGADAVDVDNRRYFACDLPAARPVLIIDGSPDGRGGHQLSLALAPGGNTHTGWSRTSSRRATWPTEELNQQAAVCLLDVPRWPTTNWRRSKTTSATAAAWPCSSARTPTATSTTIACITTAKACFPCRSSCRRNCSIATANDARRGRHRAPAVPVLAGRRNGFLPLLMVDYYYAVQDDWQPPTDGTRASASPGFATTQPLVVEKKFGKGRVVAQLTKLSTGDTPLGRWTNWSLNPVFPVLANELVELPRRRAADRSAAATSATTWSSPCRRQIRIPTSASSCPATTGRVAAATGNRRQRIAAPKSRRSHRRQRRLTASSKTSPTSGVYEVQLQPLEGPPERRALRSMCPSAKATCTITPARRSHAPTGRRRLPNARRGRHGPRRAAAGRLPTGRRPAGALIVMLLVEQLLGLHRQLPRPAAAGATSDDPRSIEPAAFRTSRGMPSHLPIRRQPRATGRRRVVYEISRLREFDDERLPVALIAAGGHRARGVVWYLYRRDTVELPRGARSASCCLRCVALAGLFVFFLGIERRTTREVVHNSQVAVLVDVSQSMGLGEQRKRQPKPAATRIEAVVDALANSPLVAELRQTHDVNVARFDRDVEPVVSLPKESRVESRESRASKRIDTPSLRLSTLDPTNARHRSTGRRACSRAARKRGSARRSPISCALSRRAAGRRDRDFRRRSKRRHRTERRDRSRPPGEACRSTRSASARPSRSATWRSATSSCRPALSRTTR